MAKDLFGFEEVDEDEIELVDELILEELGTVWESTVDVDLGAVDVYGGLSENVRIALGDNQVIKDPPNDSRVMTPREGKYFDEDGVEIDDPESYAKKYNHSTYKRIIADNYESIMENIESQWDGLEVLDGCRELRKLDGVAEKASKRVDSRKNGDSTYGKIVGLLRKHGGDLPVYAYGVGGPEHTMAYLPGVVRCYDVTVPKLFRGGFYRRGDLHDWREHLSEKCCVVSDASLGGEEGSMCIPEEYYKVYEDMAAAGHIVIAKVDKASEYFRKGSFSDVGIYRRHNREAFVVIGVHREENTIDVDEVMREGNLERMGYFSGGMYEVEVNSQLDSVDICRIIGSRRYRRAKVKPRSAVEGLKAKSKSDKKHVDLCKDNSIRPYKAINKIYGMELPCILMDMEGDPDDPERFIRNVLRTHECEFDKDYGWIALKKRRG